MLGPTISVAYAGLSNQALRAIRSAREALVSGQGLDAIKAILISASAASPNELDFILVSHAHGAELRKIWNGNISAPLNETAIGQTGLVKQVLQREAAVPTGFVPNEFEEEFAFTSGFDSLFTERGVQVDSTVGGFAMHLLCSPLGHCYESHGGVLNWDERIFGLPETEEQRSNRLSGATEWRYNIQAPRLRGVGVVGVVIPRAGIGYIYSPLECYMAEKFPFKVSNTPEDDGLLLEELGGELDRRASAIGGGIKEDLPPPGRDPPSADQLEKIITYAANAPNRTVITQRESAFWIECWGAMRSWGILLDFCMLQTDPVGVACATIDRMNAEACKPPV